MRIKLANITVMKIFGTVSVLKKKLDCGREPACLANYNYALLAPVELCVHIGVE
jgi:hypothetical protein